METTENRFTQMVQDKRMMVGLALTLAVTFLAVFFAPDVFASSGGGEFDEIWDKLKEWMQGTLGKVLALVAILVGVVMGIGRQNLMAFVVGPAIGIGLYYSPDLIDGLMSASVPLPV